VTLSPSSDVFSHTHPENGTKRQLAPSTSNGYSAIVQADAPPKRPKSAFDLYCNDMRSVITVSNRKAIADGTFDVERALATGWRDLEEPKREEFSRRFDELKREWEAEKAGGTDTIKGNDDDTETKTVEGDEDVEMGEDGDADEANGEGAGFTAVNKA
jgi:non-histone protein 10